MVSPHKSLRRPVQCPSSMIVRPENTQVRPDLCPGSRKHLLQGLDLNQYPEGILSTLQTRIQVWFRNSGKGQSLKVQGQMGRTGGAWE